MADKTKKKEPKFERYSRARQTAKSAHAQKQQMINKAATAEIASMNKLANDPNVSARDRIEARRRAARVPTLLARQIEKSDNDFERGMDRIDQKESNFSRNVGINMERLEVKYRMQGHSGQTATEMARNEMKRRMGGNVEEYLPKSKRVSQDGYRTATYIQDPRKLTRVREAAQRAARSRDTNYVERPKGPGWEQREKKEQAFRDRMEKQRSAQYRFHTEAVERERQGTEEFGERITDTDAQFLNDQRDRKLTEWEDALAKGQAGGKDRKDPGFKKWERGMIVSIGQLKREQQDYKITGGMRWKQIGVDRQQTRQGITYAKRKSDFNTRLTDRLVRESGITAGPPKPIDTSITFSGKPRAKRDAVPHRQIRPGTPGQGFGTTPPTTPVRQRTGEDYMNEVRYGHQEKWAGLPSEVGVEGLAQTRSVLPKRYGAGATAAHAGMVNRQRQREENLEFRTEQADLEFEREGEELSDRTSTLIDKLLQVSDPDRGLKPAGYDDEFWDF